MNKLTINIEKSCYIIIDNINTHYFDNNIYIDNKLLNRVECYTFLGMFIDAKLNCKDNSLTNDTYVNIYLTNDNY